MPYAEEDTCLASRGTKAGSAVQPLGSAADEGGVR
jgi:hypothetical protein